MQYITENIDDSDVFIDICLALNNITSIFRYYNKETSIYYVSVRNTKDEVATNYVYIGEYYDKGFHVYELLTSRTSDNFIEGAWGLQYDNNEDYGDNLRVTLAISDNPFKLQTYLPTIEYPENDWRWTFTKKEPQEIGRKYVDGKLSGIYYNNSSELRCSTYSYQGSSKEHVGVASIYYKIQPSEIKVLL